AQHRGRDSACAGDLPVADVLSLGLAAPGLVTGHAESGGRAAVSGLVRFWAAAGRPYRVSDRLLFGGHFRLCVALLVCRGRESIWLAPWALAPPPPSSSSGSQMPCLRFSAG